MRSHPKAASAPSTHRPLVFMAFALACLLTAMTPIAAEAATAGTTFVPLSSLPFGEKQENQAASKSGDVAVSQTSGNVFIANHQEVNIGVWAPMASAPGASLLAKADPTSTGLDPENIAIDPVDDSLYFTDNLFGVGIAKMISDGNPAHYEADPSFVPDVGFWHVAGVAVDPATHDVLVADTDQNLVYRLNSSGTSQAVYGEGVLQSPTAVAVGADGTIYVVSSADHTVQRFSSTGSPEGPLELTSGGQASMVTVNPGSGEVAVFVKQPNESALEIFDESGNYLKSAPLPDDITVASGLAWDATEERIYLGIGAGFVRTLVPAVQPGLDAPQVVSFDRNVAHVSAVVAPGGETTTARFEYCPATANCAAFTVSDPSDPHNPWKRGPDHEGLAGSGEETIEDDLPLSSNMQWQIRVFAQNSAASNRSAMTSFDSPLVSPAVETGPAGSVTDRQAVLSGTIDTIGDMTTYRFEYGLTASYGNSVPSSAEASAGNNRIPRTVSKTIAGLQGGTVYHYRLVAKNSAGTSFGDDRTFTTPGPDELTPTRAYEQVTPTDKRGAQVNSDWHVQTSPDGEAIAISTGSGSTDGETANIRQNYMIRRGSTNWDDWVPVDAPQGVMGGIFEASTAAMSPDFSHALVISNRALTPGAYEGGGNLYVKDLATGSYTFVGGAPGVGAYQAMAGPLANETIYINGASDFSWIVFNGLAPLLPEAPQRAVYRWTESGGLSLESLLPGNVVSGKTQVKTKGVPYVKTTSADGSVVYFAEDSGSGSGVLYRRANGETTLVSHGDGSWFPTTAGADVILDGVSSDGRYAVYHTANGGIPWPLTADTAPLFSYAFYRYDAVTDTSQFLTSRPGGGSPDIYGVSDDTNTVYIDRGENVDAKGGPVVVWRDGVLHTVTTGNLNAPSSVGSGGSVQSMSPNGRYFVWISGDGTLRMYDADTNESVCVSCTVDGSPAGIAHIRNVDRTIGNRGPQVVNDEGLVFFDSPAQLTAADHNGSRDVYSYKSGRLTLISPGNGSYDAEFVDASADGRDVFFQTEQSLVSQDTDGSTDVYDARVGGGFASQSPASPPPPCVRAECGGATGSAPAEPGIGSALSRDPGKAPAAPRINAVKALGPKDRAKLANGKKADLTVVVNGPGTVAISGKDVIDRAVRAKAAGKVSVPLVLTKRALAQLHGHGALDVRVVLRFDGARKRLTLHLKSDSGKRGGAS